MTETGPGRFTASFTFGEHAFDDVTQVYAVLHLGPVPQNSSGNALSLYMRLKKAALLETIPGSSSFHLDLEGSDKPSYVHFTSCP
jgi:hypothetical protein